jgi:glutathione S-transferase
MEAPAQLKLFVDRMSQPSRTCLLFCKLAGIPFEEVRINIGRAQQRSPEFRAVNPLGKVPALQDGNFDLGESGAILRFLCDTRSLADHWYPRDPRARARVCSVLDWHGSTLRVGSMVTVWNRAISISLGFQGDEQLVASYGLPTLKAALKTIDGVWLREGPFLAGQQRPSIADLLLSCELEQLCLLDGAAQGPTMADLLAPHTRLQAWLQRLRQDCAPHYDEVHALLRKSRDRLVSLKQRHPSKL